MSGLKRVDDIGAEGVSRKRKRRPNRIFIEPRVRVKYLFDRFSGGQFLQNQLDGNARACDYRFAHHHAGIGNNHISVIAHMCLLALLCHNCLQPSVPRRVGEVIRASWCFVQLRVDPPVMMGSLLVRNQHGANTQELFNLSQRFGLEAYQIGAIEQFAQHYQWNVKSRFLESGCERSVLPKMGNDD
jgi:hypothetical protein